MRVEYIHQDGGESARERLLVMQDQTYIPHVDAQVEIDGGVYTIRYVSWIPQENRAIVMLR